MCKSCEERREKIAEWLRDQQQWIRKLPIGTPVPTTKREAKDDH